MQHPEVECGTILVAPLQQTLIQQRPEPFEKIQPYWLLPVRIKTHRVDSLERASTHKDGETPEQDLLLVTEQRHTPGNRCPHRLLPCL
jgi:hypothetical protein